MLAHPALRRYPVPSGLGSAPCTPQKGTNSGALVCRPTEVYSFKGPSLMNRRDQKKGQQRAVVSTTPDGELEVTVTWDEPNPGAPCQICTRLCASFVCMCLMFLGAAMSGVVCVSACSSLLQKFHHVVPRLIHRLLP